MMKETNETKEELTEMITDFKNKGCLFSSLAILFIVISSILAVRYASFNDNLIFFVVGISGTLVLPLSGLLGIIQNIKYARRNPDKEVGPMIGYHLLILLIGVVLCAFLFHEINNFRWPG